MATAVRFGCMRHISSREPVRLVARSQRRWARVHDVRFVTTQHASERITDRYRQKLEERAKTEGHENIGSLKDAYKERISDLRRKAIVPGATGPLDPASSSSSSSARQSQAYSPTPPPPPQEQPLDSITPSSPNHKPPGLKTLDSFLDMPKVLEMPPREIEALWRLCHAQNAASLCATMPTDTFEAMAAHARRHPQFVLPGLPRKPTDEEAAAMAEQNSDVTAEQIKETETGAPIHFMQWTFPSQDTATVLFTHIHEFKERGEYARPHTTITFHTELAGPKGLVLSQGSVIESRGVTVEEGKWLVMCLQKFYHVGEQLEAKENSDLGKELLRRRRGLVEMFTRGDASFKVETLMDEAERMG